MPKQPKNNLFDQKLNIYFLLFNSLFILIVFVICISLSVVYKHYNIIYGLLINIPFVYICLLFAYIINKLILSISNKKHVIIFSVCMYAIKYVILLLGMIIGFIINLKTKTNIFNTYSLFSCALIYPTSSILAIIVYNIKM